VSGIQISAILQFNILIDCAKQNIASYCNNILFPGSGFMYVEDTFRFHTLALLFTVTINFSCNLVYSSETI
jgi:hypothetical protein